MAEANDREIAAFVVDDAAALRALLQLHLKQLGCSVQAFDGGAACLEALHQKRPDLVFLDLHMPGMNGDECCRQIRQEPRNARTAVVMLTAADSPSEVMASWRAGADDFLPKPLNPDQLAAKVRALRESHVKPAAPRSGQCILLADDSRFFRTVLGGALEHSGFHLLYAASGPEAMKILKDGAQRVDALVCDIQMPGMNGLEVAEATRADPQRSRTPVLLLTGGNPRPEWMAKAAALGCGDILSKTDLPMEAVFLRIAGSIRSDVTNLRAAERVPFFSVVQYKAAREHLWHSGFAYNVSTGGIFIRTLSSLPLGTEVEMQVRFSVHVGSAKGQVVWANPFAPRASYSYPIGMGVRFTDIAPEHMRAVEGLVRSVAQKA